MKNSDELIYDLIFSDLKKFEIDISEYILDLLNFEEFIADIKNILKKSKVTILSESVTVDSNTVIWKLKVKK